MKKLLGLALAGALSVAALPAVAADYPLKAPPPPIWTWTGFYIGIQAGASWSHSRWTNTLGVTSFDQQGDGGLWGGTIGWNWQAPGSPWVIGIEGDLSGSNQRSVTVAGGCGGLTCTHDMDWLGTLRARLGHANGPLLAYITGGVAWGGFRAALQTIFDNTYGDTGWTVGAGLEGALGGGWTLKGEYLYVDFGQSPQFSSGAVAAPIFANYYHTHILRAGANYKF